MPGLLEVGLTVVASLLWGAVLIAVGERLQSGRGLDPAGSLRLTVAFTVGLWLSGVVLLILGLFGSFQPAAVVLCALLLASAGRWRFLRETRPTDALAGAVLALLILPFALAPPFFYDALVYHLALPWQSLLEGVILAHPESLFSTFPPLAQLTYAVPLAVGLRSAPALVHLLSFVLAGAAIASLARRLGAPRGLAIWAGGTIVVLPSSTIVPGALPVAAMPAAEGFLIVAVISAITLALEPGRSRWQSAIVGLLVGCAAATRLQGLPWAFIVGGLLISVKAGPIDLVVASIGFVVGSLPWWLKNAILLGRPLAPLGWHREGIETLWRDSASSLHQLASGDLKALVAVPMMMARELSGEVGWLLPLALAGGVAVAAGDPARRRVAAVVVMGFAAWGISGALPRFLAPTVAVLAALVAAAATRPSRMPSRIGLLVATLALSTTTILGLTPALRTIASVGLHDLVFERSASRYDHLLHNNPMVAFDDARGLPADAKVLFVGEARAFGFPRQFIAPSQHDVSSLRGLVDKSSTADDIRRELRSQGITHVLIAPNELRRLAREYPVAPWRNEAGLRRFVEFTELFDRPAVHRDGIYIVSLDR